MDTHVVIGCSLVLLALAHSALGEARLVRPIIAGTVQFGLPDRIAHRIVRLAWHAPSFAWLGVAMSQFDLPNGASLLVLAGIPALALMVWVRSHLGWPVFLLIAVAGAYGEGWLTPTVLQAVAACAIAGLVAVGVLHGYWALGGQRGLAAALPEREGSKSFSPGPALTAVVAVLLFAFAGLMAMAAYRWQLVEAMTPEMIAGLVWLAVAVCIVRAVGDGRYVGFTKRVRNSRFASYDDRYFTPLIVLFAFGGAASVLAGAQ